MIFIAFKVFFLFGMILIAFKVHYETRATISQKV